MQVNCIGTKVRVFINLQTKYKTNPVDRMQGFALLLEARFFVVVGRPTRMF